MRQLPEDVNHILPFGEQLRTFAQLPTLTKGDIKRMLAGRGVFLANNEKESLVPCLVTLLLSPAEFESLNDCQNTREDNPKKSSSRISIEVDVPIINCLPEIEALQMAIADEYINYELTKPPVFVVDRGTPNKAELFFELERYDYNKSWCEQKNVFTGSLVIERVANDQILFIKNYTSGESEEVANKFQNCVVRHLKEHGVVAEKSELKKILFGDFDNVQRIQFFWRLTSKMDGINFTFKDILDMEFRPDETHPLPERIDWMTKKRELILKGTDIHNTFFIKETEYYPFLQFWSLESKFDFDYLGTKGHCTVNFLFRDFITKESAAEFEMNISSLTATNAQLSPREKNSLKQNLLTLLEARKNVIYQEMLTATLQPT